MPASRVRRQRATRASSLQSAVFRPKVDAFGTVRVLGNEYKARVIHYAEGKMAIFHEGAPTNPVTLDLTSPVLLKGRNMQTTFSAEGEEAQLVFQKAGCGCETPRNLRTGRNMLLEAAGLALGEPQ